MKTFVVISHGEKKIPYEYLHPASAFKVVETRNADFPSAVQSSTRRMWWWRVGRFVVGRGI